MASNPNKELLRLLSLKGAVGIGIGATIGAGIFVAKVIPTGVSGPTFVIKRSFSGIVDAFKGLSFA